MPDSPPSFWTTSRIVAWGVMAAVVAVVVGPTYLRAFAAPERAYTDFIQEWLSVRNYLTGQPIYRDVPASIRDHVKRRDGSDPPPAIAFTDPETGAVIAEMRHNAHPPVAVLVAVPFGWLDYPQAHLVWNLSTYGLFLLAIAAVIRELRIPFRWPALFPLAVLLLGNPVLNQLYQGQLNCLLAALVTAAWVADRRGRPALAGVAVGLAGAIKLYPLFLLGYFACTRRWTGLLAAVLAFAAANGLAAALFGVGAYRDYLGAVVPSVAGQFEAAWVNVSLSGFWLRLVGTDPIRDWIGGHRARPIGQALAWGACLLVTVAVAWVCWRATTREARDKAFALAIVGMLLVSPITWVHYWLLLLVPLGVLWSRLVLGPRMWLAGVVVALLWLPANFAAQVGLGREAATRFNDYHHPNLTTAENLAMVSVPHYALLGLFVLVLRSRDSASEAGVTEGK
jgi:hypothetical protein